jgi:hypothetical protein
MAANAIIAELIVSRLKKLDIEYPKPEEDLSGIVVK